MKRIITVIIKALVIEPHNKIRINEELLNIQDIILEDVILKNFFLQKRYKNGLCYMQLAKALNTRQGFTDIIQLVLSIT